MFYVYKITNLVNGKIYIGKSNNVAYRWGKHVQLSYRLDDPRRKYLHFSIYKYGKENFKVETLEEYVKEQDAFLAESEYIGKFKSNLREFGMNLTRGGEGPSGFKHTQETKEHLRKMSTGYKHTPEALAKIAAIHKGKKNPQVIELLRQKNIGRKTSDEIRLAQSAARKITTSGELNGFYGKSHSNETKEKIKAAMKGKNRPKLNLSDLDKQEIRVKRETFTLKMLAEEYNCSTRTIRRICSKQS